MSKILYAAGIEIVSGAMTKIPKGQHRFDGNMFLATHRKAASSSVACSRAYFRKVNNLPWAYALPSNEVVTQREAFATKAALVKARMRDLEFISADNVHFMAIKDAVKSYGYSMTMRSYLWALLRKNNGTFPTGTDYTFTAQDYVTNTGASKDW